MAHQNTDTVGLFVPTVVSLRSASLLFECDLAGCDMPRMQVLPRTGGVPQLRVTASWSGTRQLGFVVGRRLATPFRPHEPSCACPRHDSARCQPWRGLWGYVDAQRHK